MPRPDEIPFAPESQRALTHTWSRFVARGALPARGVRELVRTSWQRSAAAQVRPDLAAAPVALAGDALDDACERADWLGAAAHAVAPHWRTFTGEGHVLALFDDAGRMLAAEGDPAALDGLAAINFRPGARWAEDEVGTNGPGTALATGLPAHIVGAEHFCERWQRWHCAAVPLRDPVTQRVAGVLDLSGFREKAHPHTLTLALALGVAIEQALAARALERRNLVLQAYADLVARYPGDGVLAVDAGGHVLGETASVPPDLADALAMIVRGAPFALPHESGAPVRVGDRLAATWFPVAHRHALVGGCFVLPCGTLPKGTDGIPFAPGDVRVYARRFFEAIARDLGRLGADVDPDVYEALQAYHWPGNVRELKHVVRRLLVTTAGPIRVADLPRAIREAWAGGDDAHASAIDHEDARMMRVVREARTMAEAAAQLGITRSTLYRRLERCGFKLGRELRRD